MRRFAMVFLVIFFLVPVLKAKEVAWVTMLNPEKNVAELQVVGVKINLLVKFESLEPLGITLNGIVGFDFTCSTGQDGKCNFFQPFRVSINGREGELLAWKFILPFEELEVGKGESDSTFRAILRFKAGGRYVILGFNTSDPRALDKLEMDGKKDIEIDLPEDEPHCAYLDSVPFDIVAIAIWDKEK